MSVGALVVEFRPSALVLINLPNKFDSIDSRLSKEHIQHTLNNDNLVKALHLLGDRLAAVGQGTINVFFYSVNTLVRDESPWRGYGQSPY